MSKLIIAVIPVFMLLAGCAAAAPPQAPLTRSVTVAPRSDAERSIRLERHVSGLESVDSAKVVITGDAAIVGISLAGELEDFPDRRLMIIKNRIQDEVRALDPALKHVAVTASGEFVERINNLADSLNTDDTPPRTRPGTARVIRELIPPV
jgi:YhcN/YlaJ family sporulation lipoprotein